MEGTSKKKSNQEKKVTEKTTAKADLPTWDSMYEVFLDPQETPFLSSITETFENTTVDQPGDDSQSIIIDIQIENQQLCKEIHQVTTLMEQKLTHRISVLEARVFRIIRFESDKDVTFYAGFPNTIVFESVLEFLNPGNKSENISYWHSDDSATFNNQRCDEDPAKQGRPRQLNSKEEIFFTLW